MTILFQAPPRPDDETIAAFLQAHVTIDPGGRLRVRDLHKSHVTWCEANGYTPLPIQTLGRRIQAPRQRSNGIGYLLGIRLT